METLYYSVNHCFLCITCLSVTDLGILKQAENQLSTMSTYLYHWRTIISQRKKITDMANLMN